MARSEYETAKRKVADARESVAYREQKIEKAYELIRETQKVKRKYVEQLDVAEKELAYLEGSARACGECDAKIHIWDKWYTHSTVKEFGEQRAFVPGEERRLDGEWNTDSPIYCRKCMAAARDQGKKRVVMEQLTGGWFVDCEVVEQRVRKLYLKRDGKRVVVEVDDAFIHEEAKE